MSTIRGFDAHAPRYDVAWDADPAAVVQRRRVHDMLAGVLPARGRVLDLGCGTGTDAAWMARRGLSVVGVDASNGMLAVARERCAGLDVTLVRGDLADPPPGPFLAAVSNFGALNCVADLRGVAAALADRLVPGAPFVMVWMPRVAPAEIAAAVRDGDAGRAMRRWRGAAVGGEPVAIWYHSWAAVEAAFGDGFRCERREGLGVVLPPPGSRRARFAAWLDPLDRSVGRLPGVRRTGDHAIGLWRRR